MINDLTNARDVAVLALHDRDGNVSAHLDRMLYSNSLPSNDRSLARELALGTLRRQGTIRVILNNMLAEPGKNLPGVVREILFVAIYQVIFMERIPAFAAVNEAVEQASRFRHHRQSGLVNGVLRTLTQKLGQFQAGTPPLRADVIPVGPDQFRVMASAIFADPEIDLAGYISQAYSMPQQLVQRWLGRHGKEQTIKLAVQANVRAPLIIRPNSLKITTTALLELLRSCGAEVSLHENLTSVVLHECGNLFDLPGFKDGLMQPQDSTACMVGREAVQRLAELDKPKQDLRVLDFCAAPGTKTTHIAESMYNSGTVIALDVADFKLERIRSNCHRLGITNVQTMLAPQAATLPMQSFDLVLADVPCSNTGVLSRRAESRWRFSEDAMRQLVRDQQLLIQAAAQFVRPGGFLIYSTCSIESEEDRQVAEFFLKRRNEFELVNEKFTMPAGAENHLQWQDGGYFAVFRLKK